MTAPSPSPLVSVVLPVYNGATYLEEAVRSVLTQTLRDLELVVVDDGSNDETPAILARLKDDRLRVITQPNQGIAAALNAGVAAARGRYIARMDADDRSRPVRLERQSRFLDDNPDIAAVGSSYRLIDERGKFLAVFATLVSDHELRRDLFVRCPFGHGTMMIRASALHDVGGYDPAQVPAEDYDLWIRLMVRYRVANLPQALYEYRVHGQGDLSTQRERGRSLREALWSRTQPPGLSTRRAVADLRAYLRTDPDVRTSLTAGYLREHRSLLVEAARRHRWRAVLALLPGATVLACFAAGWALVVRRHRRGPSDRPLRVLVVGHDGSRSGAALQLLHLVAQWARTSPAPELCVVLRRGGPLVDEIAHHARVVTLVPLALDALRQRMRRRGPVAHASPRSRASAAVPASAAPVGGRREWAGIGKKWLLDNLLLAANRAVRRFDPDVVFVNTATHGDVVRRLPRAPVVTYVHEQEESLRQIALTRQVDRLLTRSDCVLAVSASVRDDLVRFHGLAPNAIDVVHPFAPPSGVHDRTTARRELLREAGLPPHVALVGGCGALTWNKAPDTFVELAAAFRARAAGRSAAFVWLGADPSGGAGREQLMATARATSVDDMVRFLPPRGDTASFFAALDLFTVVSRTDAYPVVVLEAARQGVPTVCFAASGGAREFVGDDAGVVVPGRDVGAMADAVAQLLRDEALRHGLGGAAKAREAGQHSIAEVSCRVLQAVTIAAGNRDAAP